MGSRVVEERRVCGGVGGWVGMSYGCKECMATVPGNLTPT